MRKDINGYNGEYQIDIYGNVWSFKKSKEIILKPQRMKNGYRTIGLKKNGIGKTFLIHRLVAIAFIDNPENKPEVNHINGNKNDNTVSNLEWVTHSENMTHGFENGLIDLNGENQVNSKLKEKDIQEIILLRKQKWTCKQISKKIGVSSAHINRILNNKRWKYLNNSFCNKDFNLRAKGEKNGNSKLNEEKVRLIRQMRKEGKTLQKIADEFGVNNTLISQIVRYKIWKHVE